MHDFFSNKSHTMTYGIFAILALAFVNPVFSQADFSPVIQRISKSVVVIKGNNGQGSGFIVSPDGKIATNLHVIRGMDQGAVQLSDGEIFDTFTVIGVDPRRDLAIIKIAGFNLPAVDLGDSDAIKIGEPVAVVGSPRGLSGTITTGVLSAIRPIDGTKLLQTDAAVNPGNSGGPLIKLDGTVVGIVVAKVVNAENLNFAIPINFLRGILGNLTPPMTLAQFSESLKGQTDIFAAKQEVYPREWKSLQSPNTRRLIITSDSITGENHLSADQLRWGTYARWDIKKIGDTWLGKAYSGGRCLVQRTLFKNEEIKNANVVAEVELSLVTPRRIEGRQLSPRGGGFDCATNTHIGPLEWSNFIWVPVE